MKSIALLTLIAVLFAGCSSAKPEMTYAEIVTVLDIETRELESLIKFRDTAYDESNALHAENTRLFDSILDELSIEKRKQLDDLKSIAGLIPKDELMRKTDETLRFFSEQEDLNFAHRKKTNDNRDALNVTIAESVRVNEELISKQQAVVDSLREKKKAMQQ